MTRRRMMPKRQTGVPGDWHGGKRATRRAIRHVLLSGTACYRGVAIGAQDLTRYFDSTLVEAERAKLEQRRRRLDLDRGIGEDGRWARPEPELPDFFTPSMKLRLMTFNCRTLMKPGRLALILRGAQREGVAAVCLQGTRWKWGARTEFYTTDDTRDLWYCVSWPAPADDSHSGVCICIRATRLCPDDIVECFDHSSGRVGGLHIRNRKLDLILISLYMPAQPSWKYSHILGFAASVIDRAAGRTTCFLGADFNEELAESRLDCRTARAKAIFDMHSETGTRIINVEEQFDRGPTHQWKTRLDYWSMKTRFSQVTSTAIPRRLADDLQDAMITDHVPLIVGARLELPYRDPSRRYHNFAILEEM